MKDFRRLQVWQKSHALTLSSYRATAHFPREETFGLVSQIRRCAASIAANIAEGCGRTGDGDFSRFLNIAAGSGSELEYHFLLARDLGMLNESDYRELHSHTVEVRRMLTALLSHVQADRGYAKANC